MVITLAALWWSYWVRESQPGLAGGGGNSPPGSLNPLTAYSAFNSPKSKDRWPVANLYSGLREFAIGKKREAINPIKVFSTSRNVRPILQEPITWAEHMPLHEAIFWVLRIACSLNFLFHGAWGVVGKESWIPFFGVANISVETAWMLQPWVGVMDISLGLVVLFAPTRWALLWMIVWAIWSASLRPLTGTAWWYFLERSGNYGPPLALLLYAGRGKSVMDWIMPFQTPALTRDKIDIIMWVLRVSIAIQLISHGLYGALEGKQLLIDHFASVGLPGGLMDPEAFLITVGWIEIFAGILILLKPLRAVVALVLLWEVFIGLLFPISGLPGSEHPQAFLLFRTLERFGDYAGPFGILLLMSYGPMWKKLGKSSESVTAANSGAAIGID